MLFPCAWEILPADSGRARALANAIGVHPITAQLLLNRGIQSPSAAAKFFHPRLHTFDEPSALPDLERGIVRLRRAIAKREPMLIFGDSDVDGLTASVMLYEALQTLGGIVRAKPSNRITDGYGLPHALVQHICRSAVKLVILVDCGTNQPEAVRLLASHGIETIIIDHHVPLDEPSQPCTLINPHAHSSEAYRELSSAGLVFKMVQAFFDGATPAHVIEALDLAALGTVADCSPLVVENRIIVSEGVGRIVQSPRVGLRRLCEATRTSKPEHVLTRLVPRLNASGRLGDAAAVWHLLRRQPTADLNGWLEETEAAHTKTKTLHRHIMAEAQEQVNRLNFKDHFVMVVSRKGWHQGLMGPLASQLAQRYGRPAIAIAMDDEQGTGSGRSIPFFNLLNALKACEGVLVRFGGHAQACGLTVALKQLERFQTLINQEARHSLGSQGLRKTRIVDLELSLEEVQDRWVEEVESFAPFGQGNVRPSILIRQLTIDITSPRLGKLSDGNTSVNAKGSFATLVSGRRYDVVASPTITAGELGLAVSDVKDVLAPWRSAQTSGRPYTHAPA